MGRFVGLFGACFLVSGRYGRIYCVFYVYYVGFDACGVRFFVGGRFYLDDPVIFGFG